MKNRFLFRLMMIYCNILLSFLVIFGIAFRTFTLPVINLPMPVLFSIILSIIIVGIVFDYIIDISLVGDKVKIYRVKFLLPCSEIYDLEHIKYRIEDRNYYSKANGITYYLCGVLSTKTGKEYGISYKNYFKEEEIHALQKLFDSAMPKET